MHLAAGAAAVELDELGFERGGFGLARAQRIDAVFDFGPRDRRCARAAGTARRARETEQQPGQRRKQRGAEYDQRHAQRERKIDKPLVELEHAVQRRDDESKQQRRADGDRGDEDEA